MSIDWKSVLRTVAPTLATALGGPLAGAAVASISAAIGKPDATQADIATIVASGNPDILLKLKEAEQTFSAKMKELDIELEKVNAGDRASARQREVTVKDNAPKILAVVVTVGFFGVLAYMFKYGVPKEGDEALLILLGALGAGFSMVLSYYFGSSSGSAQSRAIIEKLAK